MYSLYIICSFFDTILCFNGVFEKLTNGFIELMLSDMIKSVPRQSLYVNDKIVKNIELCIIDFKT